MNFITKNIFFCLILVGISATNFAQQNIDTTYIYNDSSFINNENNTTDTTLFALDSVVAFVPPKIKFIKPYKFFTPSNELNKPRIGFVAGSIGGLYAAANIMWSKAWYSKYDKSKFHTFNDLGEWQQMDKAAHIFNAYFISSWTSDMYKWSGVHPKHAIWIGALTANMWQLSIEINDGLQKKWGFSWGDIGANLTGSAIFAVQEYLWHEQKFNIKISAFPVKYANDVKSRTDKLYGTTFSELILKDYNALTFWLSASPGSFIKNPNSKFPKWIQVSVGYGTSGMLGGFENKWCNDGGELENCTGTIIDRSDIKRVRKFYVTADIDWTRIPTKSHALKTFFKVINIVKIPFPALEFNTSGKPVKWNWFKF